jgi:hypothetical protein
MNVKLIIRREGLILAAIISLALLLMVYPSVHIAVYNFIGKVFSHSNVTWVKRQTPALDFIFPESLEDVGWVLLFYGYPMSLFVRLMLRAVEILGEGGDRRRK